MTRWTNDKLNWGNRPYAVLALCAATAIALPAQTFTTLTSFTDGYGPWALVQATNGDLYGITNNAGANGQGGTVFKMTPSGTLTTLYNFCSQENCADGEWPFGALVQATNGDFYGTTAAGGANGYGTVFKITPSGKLTTLYSFCSQGVYPDCTDGNWPQAVLIQATNGDLYGTTRFGGAGGSGTVFKITPSGTLTTVHSFDGTDGQQPQAGLIQATNGYLYGTTVGGGRNSCIATGYGDVGCGTVFKITPSGTLTTIHSFCSQSGCPDGETPEAALVQATDGDLYGTTSYGGANGYGTVFKITPSGKLTTLHSFDGMDGEYPPAGLVQGTDGNFYGTTYGGGANGYGTVFKITPSGTLTTLYSLCAESGCTDGGNPNAGLVQDTNGVFYGTAWPGVATASGVVFSLSVGLGPFVETQTTSGKVGAAVRILGSHLTGATSVTFNGTAATFTVVSASLITTTVPTGATTGTVQVVTPSGTLSSNVPFRVP